VLKAKRLKHSTEETLIEEEKDISINYKADKNKNKNAEKFS